MRARLRTGLALMGVVVLGSVIAFLTIHCIQNRSVLNFFMIYAVLPILGATAIYYVVPHYNLPFFIWPCLYVTPILILAAAYLPSCLGPGVFYLIIAFPVAWASRSRARLARMMDKTEARQIIAKELTTYRGKPYSQLLDMIDEEPIKYKRTGESGKRYQIEIETFWADRPNGNIRVVGSIVHDGWPVVFPLNDEFTKNP